MTLTGCVIQGSGPAVFLFDNAKTEKATTDKGRRFLLAVGKDDVALVNHVNHQVTIQGSAETKVAPTPAAGQQPLESELPKLTIQGHDDGVGDLFGAVANSHCGFPSALSIALARMGGGVSLQGLTSPFFRVGAIDRCRRAVPRAVW